MIVTKAGHTRDNAINGLGATPMQCGRYRAAFRLAVLATVFSFTAGTAATNEPAPQLAAPSSSAANPSGLTTEQASYEFGVTFGEQLHRAGVSDGVSMDALTRGLADAIAGKKLNQAEQQQLTQYVRQVHDALGARNQAAATDYLTNNAKARGIRTTASGLQYRIVAAGKAKAASPGPDDQVTVQYTGRLLDGTQFDSSYSHGGPATFQANHTLRGWQEALVMMKPGSKWQLFIPPDLGYGSNPPPGIPPGALLLYDVELLGVQPANNRDAPEPEDHHDERE
jgi:FKBP-type peptidyl-prolyl cis-trans isomerase